MSDHNASAHGSANSSDLLHLRCEGTLRWQADAIDVTFSVRVASTGSTDLDIEPIPRTEKAHELHRHISESAKQLLAVDLTVEGRSTHGDDVVVSGVWPRSAQFVGATNDLQLRVKVTCGEVRTLHAAEQPSESSRVQYRVRGLSCFPAARAKFDFAEVSVQGAARGNDDDGGIVVVEPTTALVETEIDSGISRVLHLLSLANGRRLRWWVRERIVDGRVESLVRSTGELGPSRWRAFPVVEVQPFFEAAGRAYTAEMASETGLAVAIQWVLAHSAHEEVRFLQMMTALEHLLEQRRKQKTLLPKGVFRRLRAELESKVDDFAAASGGDDEMKAAYSQVRDALQHIDKGTLRNNVESLLAAYRVPVHGIEDWGRLIKIRNSIVHTGIAGALDDEEVMRAERVGRELLVRIFLAMLSYEGRYISWLDGHEIALFRQQEA